MDKIKIIATDLDGTILYNGKFVNDEVINNFRKLQKDGYLLTIVTGQSYVTAAKYALELNIDKYFNKIICQNGAYITTVDKFRPEKIEIINSEIIKDILVFFNENSIIVQMLKYDEFDTIYFNDIESNFSIKSKQDKKFIDINKINDYSKITHIWTSIPTVGFEGILDELKINFKNKLNIVSSYTDDMSKLVFMISDYKANKGSKLMELLTISSIEQNQTLAFGDGENDIQMFEKINNSVAMGNANEKVKKSAKYETDKCRENGVINFIKKNL